MIDKVIRIFTIINAIQANPGISAADLALKCDVNIRTIYRDIDIITLIAPVTNEGRGNGYRFMGKFFLYPPQFHRTGSTCIFIIAFCFGSRKITARI
jgi:predicted DNA-binding transcriptional regulator YafY